MDRDLNDVLIFTKVVESGSFTAAARGLGLPNSTVSRRVARLEANLGLRLLQRTTRKLNLTEAGQLYYDRSAQAFAGLEEAEHILAETQSTPRGRVRITAPVEHSILMRLVTPFLEAYPEVRVDLELTNRHVNLVHEGFDVAIHAGQLADSSVVAYRLMDSPFQLVASPSYLDQHGEPLSIQDLSDHDCIVFGGSSSNTTWQLPGPAGTVKVPIRSRVAVNHFQGVRDAALAGLGIALLPSMVGGEDLRAGRLRVVLDGISPPPVPVWVLYPARQYLAPAVRVFVDFVKANFRKIMESSETLPL